MFANSYPKGDAEDVAGPILVASVRGGIRIMIFGKTTFAFVHVVLPFMPTFLPVSFSGKLVLPSVKGVDYQ